MIFFFLNHVFIQERQNNTDLCIWLQCLDFFSFFFENEPHPTHILPLLTKQKREK